MLQLTHTAMRIIRADQTRREAKAAAKAKAKCRQLNHQVMLRLVESAASILRTGEPTYFEFEGACRSGIRRSLIMQGWKWVDADNAAADVVSAALKQIGAVRPTWDQGQPECAANFSVEHYYCSRCGTSIPDERKASGRAKFCSDLCSTAASLTKARMSGERRSLADYLAQISRTSAEEVRQRTGTCEQCNRPFIAHSGQLFCSVRCRGLAERSKPEVNCEQCGTAFRSRLNHGQRQKYCSKTCADAAATGIERWRKPRPQVTCEGCGSIFSLKVVSRPRRFCSQSCANRKNNSDRARMRCEPVSEPQEWDFQKKGGR
ncbi:hypothetical protein [Jiella sonneratiae]|uniref:Uncharacterized protein n=1 Tax=Jiella sonneratiae TaxID=2816856 RepID=A0ABS3J3H0_9HYPH|nr:hypothetical protein [Jiella sonneratiae]MBO0904219.1 hypothetical protein [Jiella sonneratiae]